MLMCGVGAKSVAHLMKFHLLQLEVVKVKFLMNSIMTLTVQQDFKGQCHYDKVKSRSHHDAVHLTTPNQCPYQASTSYTLRFPRYSLDKIL